MSIDGVAFAKSLRTTPAGRQLTRTEKLLLVIIGDYLHPSLHEAWASHSTLAEDAMMSRRQAIRLINKLTLEGVLGKGQSRLSQNGSREMNSYRFCEFVPRQQPKITRSVKPTPSDMASPPLVTPRHYPSDKSNTPPSDTAMSHKQKNNTEQNTKTPLPPSGGSDDETKIEIRKPERPKDEAFEIFAERFRFHRELAYRPRNGKRYAQGDFVMLAELRRTLAIEGKGTPAGWQRAVEHYFRSELTVWTLADLCDRYDVFAASPIDRFKQPIQTSVSFDRQELPALPLEFPDATPALQDAWTRVLARLQQKINQQEFDVWFKPMRLFEISKAGTAHVEVPNAFYGHWLAEHVEHVLPEIRDEIPGVLSVKFLSRTMAGGAA